MRKIVLISLVLVAAALIFVAGCTTQYQPPATPAATTQATQAATPVPTTQGDTIKATSSNFGPILTDPQGKTLYYFTRDTTGQSSCAGTCLGMWPAFAANPVSVSAPLKATDFSVVTRSDGVMQTAYMGRPLYYFKNDANPGDMNGQGYNGVWYVALVSGSVPTATPIPAATTMAPTVMTTTQGPVSSGGY